MITILRTEYAALVDVATWADRFNAEFGQSTAKKNAVTLGTALGLSRALARLDDLRPLLSDRPTADTKS